MEILQIGCIKDPYHLDGRWEVHLDFGLLDKWMFFYDDGSSMSLDSFPIPCELVGSTINEGVNSFWDFSKDNYCPIKINGKWGFINNKLNIICTPIFEEIGVIRDIKCGGCNVPPEELHEIVWTNGILPVKYNGKYTFIGRDFQEITRYDKEILEDESISINSIIEKSKKYLPTEYRSCPWLYRDDAGRTLKHGAAVLETKEQCCAYMAAYGSMHCQKLMYALNEDNFPYELLSYGFEIYDWGCGQGIGTLALIKKLKDNGLINKLGKVFLEEPSHVARFRALIHVQKALEGCNVAIDSISKYLPSDGIDSQSPITSIDVGHSCAVHLFSNILDIESVSLKGVAKLISSSGTNHIVLCIGPANLNECRINSFCNYFIDNKIRVFTNFRDTNFGHHPNGKSYGCFIKGFSFKLTQENSVLHEYRYFAPVQLFASYTDYLVGPNIEEAAFEILAPFDMSVKRIFHPLYALMSNLISRGCPTYASKRVIEALEDLDGESKHEALLVIARIQKTFVEALISGRLMTEKETWKFLVIEDETNVGKIALEDILELYAHLLALTADLSDERFPQIDFYDKTDAPQGVDYDLIIDVSVRQVCEPKNVAFSKYHAYNDCYFIVRSSERVYESRTLYTTERIKYMPLVQKDFQGNYVPKEELVQHLRYFLQLIFRKEDFRPGQLPILSRALQLKSVIGLLPTGGGKSLTYQLAALLQPGVTLVVDPLKGLMKDQYDGLLGTGIDCISFIHSDVKDKKEREAKLTQSQFQIMFLSPERLCIHHFRETLRSMRESNVYFAYGVIDEVHCVSEWGHDFRLAYLHLGRNLYNYVLPKEVEGEDNHISLFGLTATASFDVLADVERELSGNDSYSLEDDATVRYENTNRLELQYNIYPVDAENVEKARQVDSLKENELFNAVVDATHKIDEIQLEENVDYMKQRFFERENVNIEEKKEDIMSADLGIRIDKDWFLNKHSNTTGIVFCLRAGNNRISVESVSELLREKGIRDFSSYKGGDDTSHQDDFLRGDTNLMVATKAFGMGIDKANVRFTFHLNYPGSLESFVQEAGRAGRDKKMALATILYSPKKFFHKNVKTDKWEQFSADYINNLFFYNNNFLGQEYEIYILELLMKDLPVRVSNEEFIGVEEENAMSRQSQGIIRFINRYPKDTVLTYYIDYIQPYGFLDKYNNVLVQRSMPLFDTPNARNVKNSRGYSYQRDYGSTTYRDAIQKAIYRLCVIGVIDDFTEDYSKKTFRITTICQDESVYYERLKSYYRKYYSEERCNDLILEVRALAKTEGTIMACLKHLTEFIYKSIAAKRARGILDMEQFCNTAISSTKDWMQTNEDMKDFIFYYFNSKYARSEFFTYDSKVRQDVPFSLKDDTDTDLHSESQITSFELVRKYMRVVEPEIVNNDSQKDNVKHLQGAIRLIRRASAEVNPVLCLLNVFCILFLGAEDNEMLEEEMYNDYKEAVLHYTRKGESQYMKEFTDLLVQHSAILESERELMEKFQTAIQLEEHTKKILSITNKFLRK